MLDHPGQKGVLLPLRSIAPFDPDGEKNEEKHVGTVEDRVIDREHEHGRIV